jgi:hypothetical protein
MSEYPTMDVMKTNISSAAPPPPVSQGSAASSVRSIFSGSIVTRTVDQLLLDLTRAIQVAQPHRQLTEVGEDGTPKIPSLVAVFLIAQVGALVSQPRLVNLSRVHREDLRSLGGVARLLHQALNSIPIDSMAS